MNEPVNNKAIILSRFFIKGKTNAGEFAKQYFLIAENDVFERSLIIRKLVYTDNLDMYKREGFRLLRTFKNNGGLVEQYFSIKLSTLKAVTEAINIVNK